MKIIKPQTLGLLTRPFEFRREFWLGVSVLAFLPIGDSAVLLKETEMWPFLAEELPSDQLLDVGIPKVQPEFLAIAHCFAPDGIAAPVVKTGVQLGPLIKRLDVHGDRELDWQAGQISEAVPFTHMVLDWTRAYGGAGFADNPQGKGAAAWAGSDGRTFPLQNIVDPKRGADGARIPAGYGPVDQMWPARAKLAGTHDDAWLKQDFPGFARDIDWHFFNVAPPDQWLPEKLAGDEGYAFMNLHPEQKLLKGHLPGMVPRLFVVRKQPAGDGGFEEVPLQLTTVWLFPHRERLVLVHHGRARLAEEDAADIARVVAGADHRGTPRAAEEFRAVMVKRADTKGGAIYALRDEDLVPADWLVPAPAATEAEPAGPQLALARARKRAERELAALREKIKARGLDPDKYVPTSLPPPKPPPTLEELPAYAEAALAEAAAKKNQLLAEVEKKKAELAAKLKDAGVPEEEIQKRLDAKPQGPPAFSAAALRAKLAQQMAEMRARGQPAEELEAKMASPETVAQLGKAEAAIRNSYRLSAHLQAPGDALPAERSAEIRGLIAADAAAARAMYDLHGADLSGLDLSGLDLSGVCLDGANLAGAVLTGTNLGKAVLAHAAMEGAVLDGADLSGANLGKANLRNASLKTAVLKKAVLAGADLSGASLSGADLEGADLTDVLTEGSDFSGIRAAGMLAMKLSLSGLRAPGSVLAKAKFLECNLQGADLSGAVLERALFLQCKLAGIRLGKARLGKAVFVKQCSLMGAHLTGADLSEANLRETDLCGADLQGASIAKADLSRADLSKARLRFVRGKESRLSAADLKRADLHGSDFSRADLSRADLRGANLTSVAAYEANLPRAKLDGETQRRGMLLTRMRYLPVYQAPPEAEA